MKRIIAVLLALSLLIACSCAFAEEKITIAGIVFQDDQFMNTMTQGYKDAAADLGVEILTANTNNDQAREVELINTYMTQDVKGIAIDVLSAEASIAALRAANAQGMEVCLVDQKFEGVDFIAGNFCSDNYVNCSLVGEIAAQVIAEKYGEETVKIAIVQFASQLPELSASRVDGYLAALDTFGVKYEIVANQDAWLQDMAIDVVGSIITANEDLDVILAMNDGGTIGSAMAVVNAGMSEEIMVFGHDGSDQISSMVLDDSNPLVAVVAQDPYTQGYMAVETLVKAIRGEEINTRGVATIVPGTVLSSLDKEAVKEWRVAQGYTAEP